MKFFYKIKLSFLLLCFIPAAALLMPSCSGAGTEKQTENEEADTSKLLSAAQLDKAKEYKSLTEALKSPEKIYRLNLSSQHLTSLPDELSKLINLQELNISGNNFTEIPSCVFDLKNLQKLEVYDCHLNKVSELIGTLKNLKELYLHTNEISSVPSIIGSLQRLDHLVISYNHLTKLPEQMSDLYQLNYLDISNNKLSELGFSLSNLKRLDCINVYANNFSNNYIAELSKKYPAVEIQNDDCVFNTHYKELSTGLFDSAGIHNYTWRATDSEAISVLENGDSILVKIGGCNAFEHDVELRMQNEKTPLSDTAYWFEKSVWLAHKMKENTFAETLKKQHKIADTNNSNYKDRIFIVKESEDESDDTGGRSFIEVKAAGPNERELIYGFGQD